YGGAPGVASALSKKMADRFPGTSVVGTYTPPYRPLTDAERSEVADQINRSRADLVWVGLSTPKQERWMAEMLGHLNVPGLIGVGAGFDFHVGRVRRAPSWMGDHGLEWLFRLFAEPKRLWRRYLIGGPKFLVHVSLEELGWRKYD